MTSLRYAVRSLMRAPLLTASVILTIALGVAATTAIFSVTYAALFRRLPYPQPNRLVAITESLPNDSYLGQISTRTLPALRAETRSFRQIAGFERREFSLTGGGEPERVEGIVATASLFDTLGTRPSNGRAFTETEETLGEDEVVILGHQLWKRRFDADPAIVGKSVGIDGVPHTVVGVLPADFKLVLPKAPSEPALVTTFPHAFWNNRKSALLWVVASLAPNATEASAQAEMSVLMRRLGERDARRYAGHTALVAPLAERVSGGSRQLLFLLLGATGAVLLVGCLNVANLLLVRAMGRQKEMAVRVAMGAGRSQLIRQLVFESLLLSLVGGVAGVLTASWCVDLFVGLVPQNLLPRLDEVRLDLPVLLFALGVSGITGVLAGLAPAWHAFWCERRGVLGEALATLRPSATGVGRTVVRRALVIAEVAIAMVLLVGAGLLARTYVSLTRTNLGVQSDRVLTFRLTLPLAKYATAEARLDTIDRLLERLRALPSVEMAGTTNSLPVRSAMTLGMTIVRVKGSQTDSDSAPVRTVTPGFFGAMGIALVRGRLFDERDTKAKVAIVNEALVRRFWGPDPGGGDPIGQLFGVGNNTCQIVGVVRDVKYEGPGSKVEPEVYVPHGYFPTEWVVGAVKATGNPLALAPAVRTAVKAVDGDLPVEAMQTFERVIAESVAPPRFRFVLVGLFAGLALLLAVVGLYGVVAHSVSQRTREIGIRIALGSGRATILNLVLREALFVAGLGVVIGGLASLAATRVLTTFLYGVTASDGFTLAAVGIVLLAAAGLASVVPARAAASIDPVVALRSE
jgi:putative ABC transport system permease protein